MFSPFLLSTFQFKTFAVFPCAAGRSQVPRVSKEHLPQEKMGRGARAAKGEEIRAMPRLPGRLPQEGFPGSELTRVLRKELGIGIPQSQTRPSLYHFQVMLLRGGISILPCRLYRRGRERRG